MCAAGGRAFAAEPSRVRSGLPRTARCWPPPQGGRVPPSRALARLCPEERATRLGPWVSARLPAAAARSATPDRGRGTHTPRRRPGSVTSAIAALHARREVGCCVAALSGPETDSRPRRAWHTGGAGETSGMEESKSEASRPPTLGSVTVTSGPAHAHTYGSRVIAHSAPRDLVFRSRRVRSACRALRAPGPVWAGGCGDVSQQRSVLSPMAQVTPLSLLGSGSSTLRALHSRRQREAGAGCREGAGGRASWGGDGGLRAVTAAGTRVAHQLGGLRQVLAVQEAEEEKVLEG